MLKLHTIVCSTRPGRVGLSVGQWFQGVAGAYGGFEAKPVGLAEVNLPASDAAHYSTPGGY